jgi:hypothetical protein
MFLEAVLASAGKVFGGNFGKVPGKLLGAVWQVPENFLEADL